ncbi:glycosyltransferase family 4 protein [Paenibacillus sp. TAF58]
MEKKPKLWIINQYSVTPEYPASSRHYELSKYLSNNFLVTLWGSNFIHHNKTFRFPQWTLLTNEKMEGFIFRWIGSSSYRGNGLSRIMNMLWFSACLFLVGVFNPGRPDVIIGSSPPLFTAFSSMLIAKVRRAKFVLEVRDLWPDTLIEINNKQEGFEIKVLTWMEKLLYKEADLILVLTKGIGRKIEEKGVSHKKIFFSPNGIDLKETSLSKESSIEFRTKLGFTEEDYVFMYAGAHGPANDLKQLINVMSELKEETSIKLVCMGEGIEREMLQDLAKTLNLQKTVYFLPAVSKSLVNDYLSIADSFIICLKDTPLYEDALPNKLFDYVLHDKPILSTVKGEIKTFLDEYGLGFYGNIGEKEEYYLPKVMKEIANQRPKSIEQIGLNLIQNNYSREKQAESLSKLLMQLLSKNKEF